MLVLWPASAAPGRPPALPRSTTPLASHLLTLLPLVLAPLSSLLLRLKPPLPLKLKFVARRRPLVSPSNPSAKSRAKAPYNTPWSPFTPIRREQGDRAASSSSVPNRVAATSPPNSSSTARPSPITRAQSFLALSRTSLTHVPSLPADGFAGIFFFPAADRRTRHLADEPLIPALLHVNKLRGELRLNSMKPMFALVLLIPFSSGRNAAAPGPPPPFSPPT